MDAKAEVEAIREKVKACFGVARTPTGARVLCQAETHAVIVLPALDALRELSAELGKPMEALTEDEVITMCVNAAALALTGHKR